MYDVIIVYFHNFIFYNTNSEEKFRNVSWKTLSVSKSNGKKHSNLQGMEYKNLYILNILNFKGQ